MLTYEPHRATLPHTTERPWLLLLLAFAWLWPGVFSRDLWWPFEAPIFAAIHSLDAGGSWLAPTVAQHPYLPTPPLYIWLGYAAKHLFSPRLMDSYAAVRMVTVAFMALGIAAATGAGRMLLGRRHGRSVGLILLGSPGLMMAGHQMDAFAMNFAGLALCLYGLALALHKPAQAAFMLALGVVLVFYSSNLTWVALVWAAATLLPLFKPWRRRGYGVATVSALLLSTPLMLIWPYLLWRVRPQDFAVWADHAWEPLSLAHAASNLGYWSGHLLWFALPALFWSGWSLYQRQKISHSIQIFCGLWLLLMALPMLFLPTGHPEKLVPILLGLALFGAAEVDRLRRESAAFLNWFGIMLFGAAAMFLWGGFWAMNYGWPEALAEASVRFNPFYQRHIAPFPVLIALLFTPLWVWAVTRRHVRARQALTNWAAGATLVWSLGMTLFLPWLDTKFSYRPIVQHLENALPLDMRLGIVRNQLCLGQAHLNTGLILAWDEYSNLPLSQKACSVVLSRQPDTIAHDNWRVLGALKRSADDFYILMAKDP